MSGIYIHIPFCRQACHYCDFHFSTSEKQKPAMVSAIIEEINLRKDYLPDKNVDTIYFGGGTPSLLTMDELQGILASVYTNFNVDSNAEITLEANPDDLTEEYLDRLVTTPVNRLSIGVQSFRDIDLQWMNRAHTAKQAVQSVRNAYDAGIKNITIDLIYGIPGMTLEQWKENLEIAFSLPVNHLSCYCLTVESRTALAHYVDKKLIKMPDDEEALAQFELLSSETQKHGFIHYEISNFGKKGFFSRHNTSYWKGIPFLGVGPSAHSYDGKSRQWNVRNNALYIKSLNEGLSFYEREELSKSDMYNEYIMTSLRTMWGVDIKVVEERFGQHMFEMFMDHVRRAVDNGTLTVNGNIITLTQRGKFIADHVTSGLFIFKPEITED